MLRAVRQEARMLAAQRGLGVMAGLVAVACLIASGFIVSVAATLSTPQLRPVRYVPARPQNGYWQFEGDDSQPARFVPPPAKPGGKKIRL